MLAERVKDLFEKNRKYSSDGYNNPGDLSGAFAAPRNSFVTIVSCMDLRVIPEEAFGFGRGEVPVIREAGGRAKDALRSLLVLEHAFGLGHVILLHHTDCGMTHMTNNAISKAFKDKCPEKAAEIDAMNFDEITGADLHASLKSDVKWLKEQPYFSKDMGVTGAVFNLETGRAEIVQEA